MSCNMRVLLEKGHDAFTTFDRMRTTLTTGFATTKELDGVGTATKIKQGSHSLLCRIGWQADPEQTTSYATTRMLS